MSAENVFDENVEYLYRVREDVSKVEQLRSDLERIQNQDKALKKTIHAEEKSIQDEIDQLIKKRKSEFERTYDQQIDSNKGKAKSVKNKREKVKNKKIAQRVASETADIKEENRKLQIEIKTLFKAKHVPQFCNSHLYYSLFMPKRLSELFTLILSMLIGFVGLPAAIFTMLRYTVLKDKQDGIAIWSAVIVGVVIVLVGAIYFVLFNITKLKNKNALIEGTRIRAKMLANQKQMKAIQSFINKDKDETGYGLDKYDDRLKDLEEEITVIARSKQDALDTFEKETKQVLIDEVNGRRLEKLEEMKEEKEKLEEIIARIEKNISEGSVGIINQYGAFLGREFTSPEKLADLIALMEDGTAQTVSQAIAAYKGQG